MKPIGQGLLIVGTLLLFSLCWYVIWIEPDAFGEKLVDVIVMLVVAFMLYVVMTAVRKESPSN
ncbi:MAG: hypothetical protein ABSG14_06350 [Verrucomicrobiia bacterium]|jgi:hypothetical protein